MKITHTEVSQIATGGVLFTFCSHALSEFERSLVAEVCERFIQDGPDMLTSAEEWCAFREAVRAMATMAVPGFTISVMADPMDPRGVRGVCAAQEAGSRP